MSFLRFTPDEYHAICVLSQPLDLRCYRPLSLKRLFVLLLSDPLPVLAQRISSFSRPEFQLLFDHLREKQHPEPHHDLTVEELEILAQTTGPLLFKARFFQPLKRVLVQHFRKEHPALAAKLDRLSERQFEGLCQRTE